ncbi:MAG: RDD family protein [Clostridia bacterium]|nr:RDD family protein [Clostridia bacterium]
MFELRKIGIVKRASALLLDVILLAVLSTGFIFLISLICNYKQAEELSTQYYNEWEDYRKEYIGDVASFYGFVYEENEEGDEFTITKDGQESSFDAVMKTLVASAGEDPETAEAYEVYLTLTPVAKVNAQYKYVYSMLFMMVSIGILLAYIVLEFVIPIILKNGQTVGKKVFEICLVRPDCVKINNLSLFARTILGKYAIETMFPVLLVFLFIFGGLGVLAIILFAALVLLNVIVFFATKNRTPIHDLLASTVVADKKLQMIYESEEELAQKKALHQSKFLEEHKD